MKYIDLFGGIGGFRLGINKTTKGEWKCAWYCDNDKYAAQVYNKNFKEKHKATDIREVRNEDIPEHELICAGFPCQSFSIAGKRLGFKDTRGTLFYEILRIARFHKTKYLFLENVKGLLSHDEGRTFAIILTSLWESGYDVQWQVLNSKYFGVPQNRERVFIIASLRGEPKPEVFPIGINAGEAQEVSKGEDAKMIIPCLTDGGHSGGNHSDMTVIIDGYNKNFRKKDFYCLKSKSDSTVGNLVFHQHSKDEIREFNDSPTLCKRMGTGGNNIPCVIDFEGKVCTHCKTKKTYEEFHKDDRHPDGYRATCKKCRNLIRKKHYKTTNGLRSHLQSSAIKRGIIFNLSIEEFKEWYDNTDKKCVYCEIPEESYINLKLSKHNSKRLTIDRINNSKGYEINNLCLSCDTCNLIKGDKLSFNEMKDIGNKYIKPKWKKLNNVPMVLQHSRKGKITNYNERDIAGTLHQPSGNTTNFIKEKTKIRRLTPIECERLQGFPDNWTIGSDTQRYKQLGNAVTVNVIEAIINQWMAYS